MPIFIAPSFNAQRGASSLENAVAIMVFLLLALAAFESAHWLLLRQALNTALLDTARIAATQQAHPQIINEAFAATIDKLPAFAFKATDKEQTHWHIEKITTAKNIRHDYQALQYQQGNTQIFDDNTLHLRLHYLHKPLTPLVRAAIYAYAQGYVPIVTDVKVVMQSDQSIWQNTVPAPVWLRSTASNDIGSTSPINPTPDESTVSSSLLPPWQPSMPPTAWQPPNSNKLLPIDSCDSDFCCAPNAVSD